MLCVCDPGVSLLKVVNFSKIRDVCDLILGVSLLSCKVVSFTGTKIPGL